MQNLPLLYLNASLENFKSLKSLSDRAIEQLNESELFFQPDEEANSIAIIMRHMAGNMISRWTNFLTSDGEKPGRNRDDEFINYFKNKIELLGYWEKGWECLFDAVSSLTEDDLFKTVYIRGEPHSAIEAINRQVSHYAYHTGQIVFLAKHIKSKNWKPLSIPRGKSEDYNKTKFKK